MKQLANQLDEPTRRSFMAKAAMGALGVGIAPWIQTPMAMASEASSGAGRAKRCIYVYLNGGMTHLDTFDPKPGSGNEGPLKAIKTNADGIQLGQLMPNLAKHMDKCCVVRSLTSTQGAHERGQYFMRTSYTQLATARHPSMGPWATKLIGRENKNLPGNVIVNGGGRHPGVGFLEAPMAPLFVGNPDNGLPQAKRPKGITDEQFERRMRVARQFDRAFHQKYEHRNVEAYDDFYNEAIRLMSSEDLKAFDLSLEPASARAAYGESKLARGMLLARRLVEHGVRFVEVSDGGWDMHQDVFDRAEEKVGTLDKALGALLSELAAKGMIEDTLVVVATEFGRTPKINANGGRDHYPKVFSGLLAGGGIRGGQAYGASDAKGAAVRDNAVKIPDFNATIAHAMGLPLDKKLTSKDGRPFTVADHGKPITAIF